MAHGNSALVQAQADFARALAHLILWTRQQGYTITLGEAERPPEVAALYARDGRGITDSQHTRRLAADLHLYINGRYQTDSAAHAPIGAYWESLDHRAKWGGRFPRPDGNHYEFTNR